METKTEYQLKIKLKESDANNFKQALKKIVDESKSIGFKHSTLTEDEFELIKKLSEKLNGKK